MERLRGGGGCAASGSSRLHCLWVNLFIVCIMLLSNFDTGAANFDITDSVKKLGETLRTNMLKNPVNYSKPTVNLTYLASANFDPRGMGTLYNVTNFFMDLVLNGDAFPQGVVFIDDNNNLPNLNFSYVKKNALTLVRDYGGVVGVTIAGLLFAIIMPFVGFIFCCCRCAGRCGARSEPFEKRRDPCKRYTLGIFLSIIATVILFGVVCAFVTNQYMEAGVKQLPSKLRTGIHDTDLYLSNTDQEFRTLLVKNYQELQKQLVSVLNNTGESVQEQLSQMSNATILANLSSLVSGLRDVQNHMEVISKSMNTLYRETDDLNNTLTSVRTNLTQVLNDCARRECQSLLNKVKNISSADFDHYLSRYLPELPSVDESMRKVNELFDTSMEGGGIAQSVQRGIEQFDTIHSNIQADISQKIPDVTEALSKAGTAIREIADQITDVVTSAQSSIPEVNSYITTSERYIDKYSWYRYYVDLGLSVVLLLILTCITFGLFYGFCGKRPDEYGSDCCNRGTGARCLIAGVAFMFLFSIVLMVLTLAHFLLGMASEKFVCEHLYKPETSRLFSYLDRMTNLTHIYTTHPKPKNVNLSNLITSCHANNSLYEVLQLSTIVNVSQINSYETDYNIRGMVNDLRNLTFTFSKNFVILPDKTKERLRELSRSFSTVNFTEFSQIQDKVVNIDLMKLSTDLNDTAKILRKNSLGSIAEVLQARSEQLRLTQEGQVVKMNEMVSKLKTHTAELDEAMKFNHSSLTEAIEGLISNVQYLEDYMTKNGSQAINTLVKDFLDTFLNHITKYLNWVVERVKGHVGRCGPLSNVYNSVLVATCHQVLDPFNGFWASIGWSLVLFIPAIILSVKLATLYNKTDPYPGPLVETSEYLYDAYADHHDNIPLANHDKKHHHRRYDETYENSTGYVSEYGGGRDRSRGERSERGGTGGSHHGEARYNDMAPKYTRLGNWDFPNGGPPNYHSPPLSTEYERPPPYYYPGPGDSRR